jgi:hypothetical protein
LAGVVAVLLLSATAGLLARAPQSAGEIRGRITDWDDVPVAGAEVQIRMVERVPLVRTRSAADGTFRAQNLRPGGYRIIAHHERFGVAIAEEVWLLPGGAPVARLFMERPIRCALAPLPGTARITGTVVDWNGVPSPAFVRLFEAEKAVSWDRSRGTSTGVDGRYEIDHVPPGRHSLHVWIRGFEPAVYPVEVGANQAINIDARLDLANRKPPPAGTQPTATPARPLLSPSFGGIYGRVTDTEFGAIPGARISARGAGRRLQAISDARGIYAFSDLLPGQYALRVSLSGFRTHTATLSVAGGRWSSGDATLELGPLEPHELAVRWKLRRGESIVRITTVLGDITLAVTRNDFLACVDRGAYTPGSLGLISAHPVAGPAQLLFRIHHGAETPLAPDTTVYGLRFDEAGHLVVLDAVTSQELGVEGRVVEGFDAIDKIRAAVNASKTPVTIEVQSINRLILL